MWQIFAFPLLLGVLTTVGLVAALVGDGIWDGLSWLTLGFPSPSVSIAWPCRRSVAKGARRHGGTGEFGAEFLSLAP